MSDEQDRDVDDADIALAYAAVREGVTGSVDVDAAFDALHAAVDARTRRRRATLVVATAAAVVAVVGVALTLSGMTTGEPSLAATGPGGRGRPATTSSAAGNTSRRCSGPGSRIYLTPTSDPAQEDTALVAALNVLEGLRPIPDEIGLMGPAETYEELRAGSSKDPGLVDSVRPEDLPTSLTVRPVLDPAARSAVAALPGVLEVKPLEPGCTSGSHSPSDPSPSSPSPPPGVGSTEPRASCPGSPIPDIVGLLPEPFHAVPIPSAEPDDGRCLRAWAIQRDLPDVSPTVHPTEVGPGRTVFEVGPDLEPDPMNAQTAETLGSRNGWTWGRIGGQSFLVDPTARWRLLGDGVPDADWSTLAERVAGG